MVRSSPAGHAGAPLSDANSPALRRIDGIPHDKDPVLLHAIVHCSTWGDNWETSVETLEKRDIAAINMVLLGVEERERRAGPTGNVVTGIDHVFAGHDAREQVEQRGNTWCINTGAGFPAMNRLTLARIDVDPPEIRTFEVTDR